MATIPGDVRPQTVGPPDEEKRPRDQLRRDRITAVLVGLGLITFVGLLIWLASLYGSAPRNDYDGWMMP
jgi:hypothetical protein